jgi:mannose-6-phosphate isomerase-like protein (cupin superfamily)
MAIRSRRFSSRSLGLFALFVFFACAPARRISLQYGTEFKQAEIKKVLAENPLGASENIKITTLGEGQSVSHHLVQVRDREKPHVHKMHDSTVVMVKGGGYLMMENRRLDLSAGDIVYIPRGAVHYFVNTASEPRLPLWFFLHPSTAKTRYR